MRDVRRSTPRPHGRFRALALSLILFASPASAVGPETSALDADPDYRDARLLIERRDFPAAIRKLDALRAVHPDSADVLNWLGFSHRKLKDYPTAKRFYDAALAVDPDHRPTLEYQGEWFIETGDPASAKANLARLKALCGACHEYQDLAQSLTQAGIAVP